MTRGVRERAPRRGGEPAARCDAAPLLAAAPRYVAPEVGLRGPQKAGGLTESDFVMAAKIDAVEVGDLLSKKQPDAAAP